MMQNFFSKFRGRSIKNDGDLSSAVTELVEEGGGKDVFEGFAEKLNLLESENPYFLIDREEYFKNYPEVKAAALEPLLHFVKYGEAEGRCFPFPEKMPSLSKRSNQKKLSFFFDDFEDNGSFIYRGKFLFSSDPLNCFFLKNHKISDAIVSLFNSSRAIFLRPTCSEQNLFYVKLCKILGVEVIFDFDDPLLPEFTATKGGVRSGILDYDAVFSYTKKNSAFFMLADKIRCSTSPLAERMAFFCKNVEVFPFLLPKKYFISEGRCCINAH